MLCSHVNRERMSACEYKFVSLMFVITTQADAFLRELLSDSQVFLFSVLNHQTCRHCNTIAYVPECTFRSITLHLSPRSCRSYCIHTWVPYSVPGTTVLLQSSLGLKNKNGLICILHIHNFEDPLRIYKQGREKFHHCLRTYMLVWV